MTQVKSFLLFDGINASCSEDAFKSIVNEQLNFGIGGYCCAINANTLTQTVNDSEYERVLNQALVNYLDGSLVTRLIGFFRKEPLFSHPGPDLFWSILQSSSRRQALIGSKQKTLNGLSDKIQSFNKSLDSFMFKELPFLRIEEFDYDGISWELNQFEAEIVWVSLGSPKQDYFSRELSARLPKAIIIPVGAAFEFYGNANLPRAPKLIRILYLEWFWRLISQPKKTLPRVFREILNMPWIFYRLWIASNTQDRNDSTS